MKITYLKSYSNSLGANELNTMQRTHVATVETIDTTDVSILE